MSKVDDVHAAFIQVISDLASRGYGILYAVIEGALHHVAIQKGDQIRCVALLEESFSVAHARTRYQSDFTVAIVLNNAIVYLPALED